uniref:Uncharacterized protein n=1 Tax=Arion vulgaris TaxID=1028688 RepID=A0A0B7ADE1_9EUPU
MNKQMKRTEACKVGKTNKQVFQQPGVKMEQIRELEIRQLRYFGHNKRYNFWKLSWKEKVECKRERGR